MKLPDFFDGFFYEPTFHQHLTIIKTIYTISHDLVLLSNRSFGDKSGPPALPDLESEGGDTNGEECELVKEEKQEEEEVQSPCGETGTDQAGSGIEALSLTVQEEQESERSMEEEEEEEEQQDQKTTQGI